MNESTPVPAPARLVNFRDVGGIPAGGTTIRSGALCRSEAPAPLGADGFAALGARVETAIDLRTAQEVRSAPTPEAPAPDVVRLPLLEGAVQSMMELPTLGGLYDGMLADGGAGFARIAQIVGGARTAVLVHCTAGKDRTGVAIALLLDAVGADRDAVVADYALSEQRLAGAWAEGMLARVEAMGVPLNDALVTLITGSPAPVMAGLLARVDEDYGGAEGYLRANGLDDGDLQRLRTRLLAG